MSELKDRLRQIRKAMQPKMSQTAFGAMLGYTLNGYKRYELGAVKEVPDSFIKLVCAKTGVSEKWLRDGVGEMRDIAEDEAYIVEMAAKYGWTPIQCKAARLFMRMPDDAIRTCIAAAERIASAVGVDISLPQPTESERRIAEVRRKQQERKDAIDRESELEIERIRDGVPAPEPQPPEPNISIDAHDNHIGVNFGGKP